MAEPSTAAVGAALGAGLMAAVGIEPGPLFGALVGACLGLSFATTTGRARAVAGGDAGVARHSQSQKLSLVNMQTFTG